MSKDNAPWGKRNEGKYVLGQWFSSWFGPTEREVTLEEEVASLREELDQMRTLIATREQAILEMREHLAQESRAHLETQRQLAAVYRSLDQGVADQSFSSPRSSAEMVAFPADMNDSTQTVDSAWLRAEFEQHKDKG